MNAFAGAGEHIVGDGGRRLRGGCGRFTRGGQCRLQSTDGVVKGQAMGFENFGGHASRVADDGGEHDCAVDVPPAASARGRCSGFQYAADVFRYAKRILRVRRRLRACQHARDDIGFQPGAVDLARVEHGAGIGIVTKGGKQMLE